MLDLLELKSTSLMKAALQVTELKALELISQMLAESSRRNQSLATQNVS